VLGARVFLDTLDIRESYAFGSLATVFQTGIWYMQLSPVLTTVGARTCTTLRFVGYIVYSHIQFYLNFYTRGPILENNGMPLSIQKKAYL
jgi:hypothetical protein